MSKRSLCDLEKGSPKCCRYVLKCNPRWQSLEQTYQDHDGALNFATDAWTSPNHKPYVAVTVHFEKDGVPVAMLLDLVEVAIVTS
jgi:hypothetical protein